MELPTVLHPTIRSLPPMYAWPSPVKRALLLLSIGAVAVAYVLLAGGIIAALALMAEGIGG